jgi:hypothetical protein
MGTQGSIVVRRSLGRQLKALREAAGKTAADVETAGICGRSKLHKIENTTATIRVADVAALCLLYGTDTETRERLVELARRSNDGPGWWEDYADALPSWFTMYVELESAASNLRAWQPELVPGLLQTPAYQRAIAAVDPALTEADVERQIRLRGDRQRAVLDRPDPVRLAAVIGPGALLREVGGPAVLAEQREHLIKMSRRDNIDVWVLPWSAGAYLATKGAFYLLGFDGPADPDVAYVETEAGGRYVEQAPAVHRFDTMFASVRDSAVPIEEFTQ